VAKSVPGQKRNLMAAHPANGDGSARSPVGGVDDDAARIRAEERIKAAAADHTDLRNIVT
jgi:hypothetical protein